MKALITLFILATIAATSNADHFPKLIQLFRPDRVPSTNCLSWRFGVETNNIIKWKTIPEHCEDYVREYMLGYQYRNDSKTVCREAYFYAKGLAIPKDGRSIWIFDVEETLLSNLPYYAEHGFGVEPFNSTSFAEWVLQASAPALPETMKLYHKILSLGIKPVFLTGRSEYKRNATITNLVNAGYETWEKLILKEPAYAGKSTAVYKQAMRKKLEEEGYRIIGNIGDQWTDITGKSTGRRSFKLPNPMYYVF